MMNRFNNGVMYTEDNRQQKTEKKNIKRVSQKVLSFN